MLVTGKTKRTLVRRVEPEPSYQPRVDQFLVGLTSPFRISILKFLARARAFGEPVQPFTSIQKAIEALDHFISTANLSYHLTELKNVNLVDHVEGDVTTTGYRITERGSKILDVFYTLEGLDDELQVVHPNVLSGYVYEDHVNRLLRTSAPSAHVVSVSFQPLPPREVSRPPGAKPARKRPRGKPGPGSARQSSLDKFA